MKKKIESYQGAAGGWGAVKSVANAVRKQMDIRQDVIAMFDMNKPEGFDCPGCAWPDPKHSASFDICENGAKAIAWEVTDKQVNASFFAENTVQSLLTWGDHELEAAGRLTQPLKYDAVSDCYKPLSWQQAFDEIGARLQSYSDPNQVEFYTSGRTSNEAAFLYQLFAREYGSNNFPDCSNMCHEPTSVGLAASIGVGKGTVLLEDFEKCDLVICIGHNPGTNHPRMLTSLRALVKRGAKMIAINPLQERGLERFTAPQNPFEMLTNSETQLASAYYNVRIGGDMALLKGMMRLLIERDDAASAAGRPSLLDDEFIQTHTVGFDELRRDVLNSEWKDIERISGLSQTQIAELADAYAAAERTIICYGMGITQHEHGTQNVQQLVNLLLMKGNIGKPGAGICPLRGHSNVQGDRTVGITEKPSAEFLARLGERYGFTPPQAPGHAAIASMQAICTGQARALICMGGNFALAMPDREASAVPLTQLDLAVHVATKLNRSHLLTARHSYILPVLGRSEIDMQKSGAQAVTVEDSMSMIHASRGVLKPAGVMLKSECAVVAGIAQAALPQSVVAWEYLVEDYDRIRNDIEAVLPEFADYNQRIRHPGGFHLINAAAERRWMTPSGKANFITSKGLLEDPSSAFNSKLVMATVRSHDQYNTTIYGMDDRYRGVFGQRDVVFMSAKQAKICRVKNGERVNLIALTPDGKRSSRRMDRLKVVIYPMADRSLVTYFPESNHMLTLDNHDPLSGIPGYKRVGKRIRPLNVEKQRSEATFRTNLVQHNKQAELIALSNAESLQRQELSDNFHTIKENWHRLMNRQRWLDYWQNIYSRSLSVLPYFLLLPQFISGQINLGGLMKSRQAFMLVSNNLSWFIYKYDELAELAAVIDRLYEFHQLTEQRPTNKPKNCQHAVQVANASIRTPDNKIILENLNFHVSPGKWLLLKGYSGAGKTTLLKTLSHCWPWFKGDISSPADSWYVSQTPLIKSGLLKEIICKALPLPVDDKSLSEVLHQVGLGKLAARIHEHDRWGDILSSGEKQRIALARLILRRPKWIFLDETTSHLEEQEAIRLLRLVREKLPTSGVIMVTHQPGVWNLADDICDISTVL